MARERVLITVKTYPTLSRSYGETVCTAGVREDGSWVRIYPVPFRRLGQEERYRKFDWIECDLYRNTSDPRPESFRPADLNDFRASGHMDTASNWQERRHLLLQKCRVYTSLARLIAEAKANTASLALFRPAEFTKFSWEEEERAWNPDKVAEMRAMYNQLDLFDAEAWRQTFKLIPKLPYSFSYTFKDEDGRQSRLQILDWEIGQLYWKCLASCSGNEVEALQKVKQKYWDQFLETDLHLFLGTTQQFHFMAPNPWVIIGVFPIPNEAQFSFL